MWGRWASGSFCFYLWNDDRALATAGKGMVRPVGLLGQLQRQSPRDILKEGERINGRAGGRCGNAGRSRDQSRNANRQPPLIIARQPGMTAPRNRREPRGVQDTQMRGRSRGTREDRNIQHRAGWRGNTDARRERKDRKTAISKTLPMLRRRSRDVHRQRNGFIAMAAILQRFVRKRRGAPVPRLGDIERIAHGEGGNRKMSFEWGVVGIGGSALRTSHGHSAGYGVTSDYLPRTQTHGWYVHG